MVQPQKGETALYEYGIDDVPAIFRDATVDIPMYRFGVAKNGPVMEADIAGCIIIAAMRPRAMIGGLLHLPPDPFSEITAPRNEKEVLRNLGNASRIVAEFLEVTSVSQTSRIAVIAGSANTGYPVIKEKENEDCLEEEIASEGGPYYIRFLQHVVRDLLSKGFRTEFYMNNSEKRVQLATAAGVLTVTNTSVNSPKDQQAFVFDMKGRRNKILTQLEYLLEIAF